MKALSHFAGGATGNRTAPDAASASGVARGLTRRRAALLLASLAAVPIAGWSLGRAGPFSGSTTAGSIRTVTPEHAQALFEEAVAAVLPRGGFHSRIALRDSILRLVSKSVIDPERFASVYEGRGGLPVEMEYRLRWPSHLPIHLTAANAEYYVNLLWPVGLANAIPSNRTSPVNGPSLHTFASTAGWNLGQDEGGGAYFNKFQIVELTPEQEELAVRIAKNTFRPCCNNSTFFQDCNHGSALYGLLQLGASQGLTEGELYQEALAFNSFWFPQTYVQTAVYFKLLEGTDWTELDPKFLMGARYSALGPWEAAVGAKLAEIPGLLPAEDDGVSCGA